MSCARRNASTTAPQALMLLNSEFTHSIATKLAARLNEQHGSDTAALITAATLRCLSRNPTPQEIELGQKFLQKQTALTPAFRDALADYCLALLNSNEFVYVD
jgi:alcohol dehydrogenase class IV